jgi:hypothetical protein
MDQQISFWKIVKTDYLAFYFFALLVVLIGTLGYIQLTDGFNFPDLAGPIMFIFIGIGSYSGVIYRVLKIRSIFEDGVRTNAVINNVHIFRGRVKVVFLFEYHNQRYIAQNYLLNNRRTKKIITEQNIVIMHKPENPKSAVIVSLYR